jgi:hypothetical protein
MIFYVSINLRFVPMPMMWYHSMNDKIWLTPRLSAPTLRIIALSLSLSLCVCVMVSSEPVATMATLLNHVVSHLKTLILTELLNTLMILFVVTGHWTLSCDDYFFSNWDNEHLAIMILFPTILNDESGLCKTSVAAWTILYDIGYMSSSTLRSLERWRTVNSAAHTASNLFFQFLFLFKKKFWHIHLSATRWQNLRMKWLDMSLPMREAGM